MKQYKLIGVVLLALLFVMAACNRDDNQTTEATSPGATAETVLVNEGQPGVTAGENGAVAAAPTATAPAAETTAVEPTPTPGADTGAGGMAETVSSTILTQHTVQEREWLHQIARCYGTTPKDIVVANNLPHPGWIMAGEVWNIPNVGSVDTPIGPPCIIFYNVKAGDTLNSISQAYSVPVAELVFANYGCYGYNAHYDYVPGGPNYYGYGYLGGCMYYSYPTIYVGDLLVIPVNHENAGMR